MEEFLKLSKEVTHTEVHTVWFYFSEIQEETQVIYGSNEFVWGAWLTFSKKAMIKLAKILKI